MNQGVAKFYKIVGDYQYFKANINSNLFRYVDEGKVDIIKVRENLKTTF